MGSLLEGNLLLCLHEVVEGALTCKLLEQDELVCLMDNVVEFADVGVVERRVDPYLLPHLLHVLGQHLFAHNFHGI